MIYVCYRLVAGTYEVIACSFDHRQMEILCIDEMYRVGPLVAPPGNFWPGNWAPRKGERNPLL